MFYLNILETEPIIHQYGRPRCTPRLPLVRPHGARANWFAGVQAWIELAHELPLIRARVHEAELDSTLPKPLSWLVRFLVAPT